MSHEFGPNVVTNHPSTRLKKRKALRLGAGAQLRSGTVIYEASVIGPGLTTGHHAVIREQNHIGSDLSLWTNSVIDYGCTIGNRVKIHCNCYVSQYSVLEDDVFLAPGVILANDLYPGFSISSRNQRGPHIGRNAKLGANVTVLPYITIGAGALIGAGSVVTRDVPANAVVWGNPARVHKKVSDLTVRRRIESILHQSRS